MRIELIDARDYIAEARGILRTLHTAEEGASPPRLTQDGHYVASVLLEALRQLHTAEEEIAECMRVQP